jgi:hypothetical protein
MSFFTKVYMDVLERQRHGDPKVAGIVCNEQSFFRNIKKNSEHEQLRFWMVLEVGTEARKMLH